MGGGGRGRQGKEKKTGSSVGRSSHAHNKLILVKCPQMQHQTKSRLEVVSEKHPGLRLFLLPAPRDTPKQRGINKKKANINALEM